MVGHKSPLVGRNSSLLDAILYLLDAIPHCWTQTTIAGCNISLLGIIRYTGRNLILFWMQFLYWACGNSVGAINSLLDITKFIHGRCQTTGRNLSLFAGRIRIVECIKSWLRIPISLLDVIHLLTRRIKQSIGCITLLSESNQRWHFQFRIGYIYTPLGTVNQLSIFKLSCIS